MNDVIDFPNRLPNYREIDGTRIWGKKKWVVDLISQAVNNAIEGVTCEYCDDEGCPGCSYWTPN